MNRRLLPCLLALLLAACSDPVDWKTRDISGLMPELAFTLTSERGEQVDAADYRGKALLLFFGYTHCPDICPLTLARLRAALNRLEPRQRQQVRVLFVSVDPARDDPARLREYTDAFGPDVTGLTGTQAQLQALTRRYRVTYGYGDPDENGDYLVSHSSAVFAFDPEGEVRLLIRDEHGPEAIAADLQRLLPG
ncbi:MAG: SCO family protein [Candidatus Competibacterales bacterium]|nr:SCO family protein [Candidatus Competibacterales bacterium]